MSNVIRGTFPGEGGSSDGSGPEDPMLAARVEALEKRMDRFEQKLDRVEETLQSLKITLVEITATLRLCATKSELSDLQKDLGKIREDGAYVRGRLENIPTFWQMLALISALLIGIAGIAFTAGKFLH
jgi:hypothetical protein